jgi:hypothetical protein
LQLKIVGKYYATKMTLLNKTTTMVLAFGSIFFLLIAAASGKDLVQSERKPDLKYLPDISLTTPY